ncbi:MAG: glycosyltransferase family 39 protein [Phycisphaeraceae bacterium]|nr:glycosyltransferase family 39 protein [Phycisphaeraceae bacterium]
MTNLQSGNVIAERRLRAWERLLVASPVVVQLLLSLGPLLEERWQGDAGLVAAISAKAAREGHWWSLYLSAEPYWNKPPLAFWCHAVLIRLFEAQTWALKLPEVVAILLTLVAVQRIFTRLAGLWVGVLGGLLFATSRSISFLIDTLRHDYVHNALLLWGVWFVVSAVFAPRGMVLSEEASRRRAVRLLIASGVCVGGAMMVKPFWALGAYLIVMMWLALNRHREVGVCAGRFRVAVHPLFVASRLWVALAAALATALPWHLSMIALHGRAFIDQYFVKQSMERVFTSKFEAEPWWWYLDYYAQFCWLVVGLMGVGVVVWIVLGLMQVLRASAGGSAARADERAGSTPDSGWRTAAMLGVFWVVLWTVGLSLAQDKRRNYILHVIPVMAMLGGMSLAGVLAILRDASSRLGAKWMRVVVHPGLGVVLVAGALALNLYCMRGEWILKAPIGDARSEVGRLVRVVQGKGRSGPGPHMRAAIEFIRDAGEEVYVGRMRYNDSAIIYIKSGIWPKSHGWGGSPWKGPPRGSLVIFDVSRNDFIPRRDVEVFRSGHIVITRRGWALHPPPTGGEEGGAVEGGG